MRLRHALIALVPAALGVAAAVLVNGLGWQDPVPILYLRADVGTLALLLGLGLSLILGVGVLVRSRWEQDDRRFRREVQLRAADDRRRFLRRLDHELKNPLTAIRAGLANVADAPDDAARREALSSVGAQTLRISRLAADLRKLAELESRPLERAPVNLAGLLQEVGAYAQEKPESEDRRVTLTLPQAPWPLPTVMADRDLLYLAVYNLLDNALKFTRPGDTVEVRAFEDGASVVIEVADTGPGIPEDELPHVWEELYRGQGARAAPGSGLGLALVRAIVELHGGQINLRSRAGQGTVFTVRLPIKG
jgi:two-component system OmpR family sensor kinase